MDKSTRLILKSLFALAFLILSALSATAQNLDIKEPFRLKSMQALETQDGLGEFWFVGGSGNLVIYSGNNRIEKTISEADLNSIFFVNNQTAFVAGNSGELLITKNRGETWEKIELNTNVNLKSVFCLNENKCWIVGDKDGLIISGGIDGKWKIERIVSDGKLEDVYFISEKVGFAAGRNSLILKTDDGGENWWRIGLSYKTQVSQFIDGIFWFESVSFLDDKTGCVTGWDVGIGIVACTQDQGETWKVNLIEGTTFVGIVWKSKKEVYLVGEYGRNYVSKDVGLTWETVNKRSKPAK